MSSAGLVSIAPVLDDSVIFSQHQSPELNQEFILIYVAISGSMVPMRVLESDSIESLKLRIQTCKGIFTKNQKLVCRGRELARSNSLVRDYGVRNGNVLHLVLRLSDLQAISVKTCDGKEFTLHVERSRDVGYVKCQMAKNTNLEHIENQDVFLNDERVEDQMLINDLSKDNADAVIHLFVRKSAKIRATPVGKNFELSIVAPPQMDHVREYNVERRAQFENNSKRKRNVYTPVKPPPRKERVLEPVIVNPNIKFPQEISDMIKLSLDGLESGKLPIRSSEGTGGAYFMLDASGTRYLSVFKPRDEEPLGVNNPRGLPPSEDGEGLKKGTRVGEGGIRECAVYLLDHPVSGRRPFSEEVKGFSGVPPTVYVRCLSSGFNHPDGISVKTGSLQKFMANSGSCEDMGPGSFPVQQVHKIAVLDMRVANADRHAGNILVSKGEDGRTLLIPIDHGYCLPYSFEDCTFDWLYWPQARQPFSVDTVDYIRAMDAEKDIALLKHYGWELPVECAHVLRISTMLLKKGAEKGLTPFAIGSMMCRETVRKESVIEEIIQEARCSLLPECSESSFLHSVSTIMDRRLEEMA